MKRLFVVALLSACASAWSAQATSTPENASATDTQPLCPSPAALMARLATIPEETRLFGGKLRVVNVYKRQVGIMLDAKLTDTQAAQRWNAEVYPQNKAFWVGYIGDDAAFSEFANAFMAYRQKLLCKAVPKLLALDTSAHFTRSARWLRRQTGLSPVGTWYLAYGSGATDMGGLTDIGMVMDFSNMAADAKVLDALLTHELAHQIHARRKDRDHDTVLGRIVAEGLATYIACVEAAGRRTAADCIGYSDTEWQWAMTHENELKAFAKPLLASKQRADSDSVASRSAHPLAGSPGAIGYFLGYRMVESYVGKYGRQSWKSLLTKPVAKVMAESDYRF